MLLVDDGDELRHIAARPNSGCERRHHPRATHYDSFVHKLRTSHTTTAPWPRSLLPGRRLELWRMRAEPSHDCLLLEPRTQHC